MTIPNKTSSSVRKTRTPTVSSVASDIETNDVEEIDSFCSDVKDDNEDESTHIVHSTEPNEIDNSLKYDHINVVVKKSNACSNHSMTFLIE